MQKSLINAALTASVLTITSPIELIKLRIQTAHELFTTGKIKQNYQSVRHCAKTIASQQGIKSFWKGNVLGVLRFFPNESINSYVRFNIQKRLPSSFATNVFSAVLAGWTASALIYPVDILRQAMGSTTQFKPKFFSTIRHLLKQNGAKYFYKGFVNNMLGIAIFRSSFNGLFDSFKGKAHSIQQKTLIAYLCAMTAGFINYPLDVTRKRCIIVNSRLGAIGYAKNIWRKQGIKGFYKGSKLIPLQSLAGAVVLMMFDGQSYQ